MGTDIYPIETASIRAFQRYNSFIFGHRAPLPSPWLQSWCYHPATNLVLSPGSHIITTFLAPFAQFISSTTTLDFFLYFLLAGPFAFETFYLVSHSKLYMLTPWKWEAVNESLSAVTWRNSTRISMSRDRMEAANESFTLSSRLAAITMK